MANIFALKSGNWSDTTVWNTGALPTSADDVYSNNFTVTIDQNVTVLSIRNGAASPIVAGGTFILTGDYTLNCTGTGIVTNGITILTYNGTGTANINSNISFLSGVGSQNCVLKSGTGTLNITGNLTNGAGLGSNALGITTGGICNIIGNISPQNAGSSVGVSIAGSSPILNITGTVSATSGIGIEIGVTSNCNITITGNFSTSNNIIIRSSTAGNSGNINIIGNVTALSTNPAVSNASLMLVNVTGTITPSSSTPAIVSTNASAAVNLDNAILINSTTRLAVSATNITLTPGTNLRWQFYNETLTGFVNLYPAGVVLGNPIVSNVRSGTTYGPSSELAGTLIVPAPSNVRKSVPTDNTVGTGELTSEDILNSILTSSNPVAVRLRNVTTVDIMGEQIAAFK